MRRQNNFKHFRVCMCVKIITARKYRFLRISTKKRGVKNPNILRNTYRNNFDQFYVLFEIIYPIINCLVTLLCIFFLCTPIIDF